MVNPIPLSQRKVKLHCIPLHVKNPSPVKNGVFKGTAVFMPDYSHPPLSKSTWRGKALMSSLKLEPFADLFGLSALHMRMKKLV